MASLRHRAILCEDHWVTRSLRQSIVQRRIAPAWVEMLDDNEGLAARGRQSGQKLDNGLEVSC